MLLEGRTVLITGGADGIGRATALRCAFEGARVAVADVNETAGQQVVETILAAGGVASFHPCNVVDEEAVRGTVSAVLRAHGGLHVLITVAGILQGAFQPVETLELTTFERVMDVNVIGTFLFTKHAAGPMEASGGGVILCISSWAGVRGPSSSLVYGASKSGVYGYCQTLEKQLAPRGIRVNVVCPGSIDTPLKRQNVRDSAVARGLDPEATLSATPLGDPDGVAKILTFLASSNADYLLGTVFTR